MGIWEMFKEAASLYGLPFALFLALLVYVIWDSRQRESRYIDREEKYLSVIQTLSEDVKERLAKLKQGFLKGLVSDEKDIRFKKIFSHNCRCYYCSC